MKKQKKVKRAKVVKQQGDNTSIRRIVLILALISLLIFLYFVYQYVMNSRRVSETRNIVNEQIVLVNSLDKQYFSVLQGTSGATSRLKQNISNFEDSLRNIEAGSNGAISPGAAQSMSIKNVKSKWAAIKGNFEGVLAMGGSVTDVRAGVTNVSTLLSDMKLSATRLNNNLGNFGNAGRVASNLSGVVATSEQLDAVMQSVLSQSQTIGSVSDTLNNHVANLSKLTSGVKRDLSSAGNAAYQSAAEGKSELAAMLTKLQSLQSTAAQLSGSLPKMLNEKGETVDLVGQESDLVSALRGLRDSYSDTANYPISFLPLSYLGWVILWLIITAVLFGIWAIMLLRNATYVNKEATRLRLAAEERTQNDQEAILRLMDELADLSEGDLTIEAQVTEDFTGAIADSINFTVENMRDMVGTITHTSDEITRATAVSQDVSRLLTDSSNEQSRQIDTSTSTVRQMATSLHEIAENTDSSVQIARSSVDMAQEGRNRVRSTIKSMSDIRENIQETAKRIKRLGESSQEIGDIVEIIKGIADQTNVLALNAAIQATTAGEAGRGFAVVADEVQRLAERSANATKRIEVLVKTIQADANEAIASMENSTKQVVTGTDVAEEAGQSLDKIEDVSQNLASLIVNVSQATRDAAGMAGSVADNMGRLAELNEKAVQDVTTSVKSVDDLQELSTSLKDSVAGFKLPG